MRKKNREVISDFEVTKNMLSIIREFDESPSIDNQELPSNEEERPVSNGEEASEGDFEDAKKSFMETVSNKVNFTGLEVYRENKNAVFSGEFQDLSNLTWKMVLNETNGLYVDVTGLQITDDVLKILYSLNGYYKNWSDEWGLKLNQDYKPSNEGQA